MLLTLEDCGYALRRHPGAGRDPSGRGIPVALAEPGLAAAWIPRLCGG